MTRTDWHKEMRALLAHGRCYHDALQRLTDAAGPGTVDVGLLDYLVKQAGRMVEHATAKLTHCKRVHAGFTELLAEASGKLNGTVLNVPPGEVGTLAEAIAEAEAKRGGK